MSVDIYIYMHISANIFKTTVRMKNTKPELVDPGDPQSLSSRRLLRLLLSTSGRSKGLVVFSKTCAHVYIYHISK